MRVILTSCIIYSLLVCVVSESESQQNETEPNSSEELISGAEDESGAVVSAIATGGGVNFIQNNKNSENDEESDSPEAIAALMASLQGSENGTILERLRRYADNEAGLQGLENQDDDKPGQRKKRFITAKEDTRWDRGVVPYIFNDALTDAMRYEIHAAMNRYETLTCIRFVPNDADVKTKYQIDHDGVVEFVDGQGCWATEGNSRHKQHNSCCNKNTCVHEIGHSLGLVHEHQNPIRSGKIRIDWENIIPGLKIWFAKSRASYTKSLVDYDITSRMHYTFHSFTKNGKPVMSELYRGPTYRDGRDDFYARKEISLAHKCQETYCASDVLECGNDGFVTLVRGECQCSCPHGLDQSAGCNDVKRKQETITRWPKGTYSILKPATGCPAGFVEGSVTIHGSKTERSTLFHLGSGYTGANLDMTMCTRGEDNGSDVGWEHGDYCIFRQGGACPSGFQEGFVQFGDPTPPVTSGAIPDGAYGPHTGFQFCCRSDGFSDVPMLLPNTEPIVLFKHKGDCQIIEGMAHIEEHFQTMSGTSESLSVPGYGFSGSSPEQIRDNRYNLLGLSVCYYAPLNYGCGKIINLDRDHPDEEFTSPGHPGNYKDLTECNWLIKVPEGMTVKLEFPEFDIEANSKECLDYVEIRQNLIGQPGVKYCGSNLVSTMRSLKHMVMVTFRSNSQTARTGFKAKASVILPEDYAYNTKDNGRSYRGHVNYTHLFEPCLPWIKVQHCLYHPFSPKGLEAGLDENYCRNPSDDDSPWCYTSEQDCMRNYCDVSRIGKFHNNYDDCEKILADDPDFCNKDIAMLGCAVSCHDQLNIPPPEPKYLEVECSAPGNIDDATHDGEEDVYHIGDHVTYQCQTGNDKLVRTCQSDGTWSHAGYVCGACKVGWYPFRSDCYKFFNAEQDISSAIETCQLNHAKLTTVKDEEEVNFVASIRETMQFIWVGLKLEADGWYWSDGTKAENLNWKNTPRAGIKMAMLRGQSEDRKLETPSHNSWKLAFVCQYTPSERVICEDRLPNCEEILSEAPSACQDVTGFARQECPLSCNICDVYSEDLCDVEAVDENVIQLGSDVKLQIGQSVSYTCKDGYGLAEGDFGRACLRSGQLTGQAPKCALNSALVTFNNNNNIIQRDIGTHWRVGYTGTHEQFQIERDGEIIQWQYYGYTDGNIELMVWRPSDSPTSMMLVGHNLAPTKRNQIQYIDIPKEQRIQVKAGDRIGFWTQDGYGISNTRCSGGMGTRLRGWYWKNTFVSGNMYPFNSDYMCRVFSFRAKLGPV